MKNKEKAPFSRGAYYVVRNPQNYPTETFFGGGKTSTLCGEKEQSRAGKRKAARMSGFLAV